MTLQEAVRSKKPFRLAGDSRWCTDNTELVQIEMAISDEWEVKCCETHNYISSTIYNDSCPDCATKFSNALKEMKESYKAYTKETA